MSRYRLTSVVGLLCNENIVIFCFNDKHTNTTLYLLVIMCPISNIVIHLSTLIYNYINVC